MTESLPPEDPRDALIREQAARLAAQDEQIAVHGERIAALEALVAELREQLDAARRAASRNSGNSSMPPSSDDLPGRRPAARKERRAAERAERRRKPGKQPGSPGAAMRWRKADKVVGHFPQGDCACGADLADAADLGVARSYQQEDVPEPQPSRRYQHDLHRARCACGRVHVAPRPAGVPDAPLSVGPRLSAMAVYLSVFQHVPVERAQFLIADLTGGMVSAGFVHSCLGRAAGLVTDAVRLIRTLIAAAPVAGFDETTLRSGPAGDKKYVHGAFTELYSAFWLGTRGLQTMKEAGILPSFAGIVVSDRYAGYYSETWPNFAGHQACAAHLIRDFQDCAETYPDAAWPEQAMRSLRGLIRAWHAAREQGLPAITAEDREPLETEFRRAVTVGLAAVSRIPGPKNQVKQQPHLLDIKDRLGEELGAFRAFVAAQQPELRRLASIHNSDIHAEAFAAHINSEVTKPLESLERGLRRLGFDTIRSLLTVQTLAPPAVMAFVADQASAPPAVAAVGAVGTVIGSAWWQLSRDRKQLIRESPVGYLLSVKRALKPHTAVERRAKLLAKA